MLLTRYCWPLPDKPQLIEKRGKAKMRAEKNKKLPEKALIAITVKIIYSLWKIKAFRSDGAK